MPELVIRAGANDALLVRRLYGLDGATRSVFTPSRIVVDAHVASRRPDLAETARRAGVPFLVDPQTYYLQDCQHREDRWANLPFADPRGWTPSEALSSSVQDALIARCVDYQLDHGATMIIAPYVHLSTATSSWIPVQAEFWRRTKRYLDREGLEVPVVAVYALGWRLLTRVRGRTALTPVEAALNDLVPAEVALAASKTHLGVSCPDRLLDLLRTVRRLSRAQPVIAWQQGVLGEACVIAGAQGYETGIGQREACDLDTTMRNRRRLPAPGTPFGPRPVYLAALKRSIPKRTVAAISTTRSLWTQVVCADPQCCPAAGASLLADARQHAVVSRARSLRALTTAATPAWQWRQLHEETTAALQLAARINRLAEKNPAMTRIDTTALHGLNTVADHLRHDRRTRRVA